MTKQQKSPFIVVSENHSISVEQLCIPSHYKDDIESIIIPNGVILNRIEALATQIFNEFNGEPLICFCVLKEGFRFCADLTKKIQDKNRTNGEGNSLPIKISFIKYDELLNDIGLFQFENELNEIFQKNVMVVENCIHTGRKAKAIIEILKKSLPKSIKCCSLLVKRSTKGCVYIPDYIGFSIPEKVVVGYALDFNEHFRDLEHISLIKESSKCKYI